MISLFLDIVKTRKTDTTLEYACILPDPSPYGEDRMVACGKVVVSMAVFPASIDIEMDDFFQDLCEGETYQRKHFVSTLIELIQFQTGEILDDSIIHLKDFLGEFQGTVDDL